jgi:hypothetical protein
MNEEAAVSVTVASGTYTAPELTAAVAAGQNGPAVLPPRQLSAEDILGAHDLEIMEVYVPEWRGSINLRVLPADEGLVLNEKMQALPKAQQSESIFLLLEATMVHADGSRLFKTPEQALWLRTKSQKVLLRLQKAALGLQGWLDEAAAKND